VAQSTTVIQCGSPSDAARLGTLMLTAAWPGPRPDSIEANGTEVRLVWHQVVPTAVPAGTLGTTVGTTGIVVTSGSHSKSDGGGPEKIGR
jgi:hypothetical protein